MTNDDRCHHRRAMMMTIIAICVATIMNSDWADSGEATTCAHALLNGGQTAECHDEDDDHEDDEDDYDGVRRM